MPPRRSPEVELAYIAAISWINEKETFWLRDLREFLRSHNGVTHTKSNQLVSEIMRQQVKKGRCQCCETAKGQHQYIVIK